MQLRQVALLSQLAQPSAQAPQATVPPTVYWPVGQAVHTVLLSVISKSSLQVMQTVLLLQVAQPVGQASQLLVAPPREN